MPAFSFRIATVLMFLLPSVAVLSPYGIVWIAAVGGITGVIIGFRRYGKSLFGLIIKQPLIWLFGALVSWALLSTFWSLDPGYTGPRAARLVLEMGLGLALLGASLRATESTRFRLIWAFALGVVFIELVILGNLYMDGAVLAPFKDQAFQTGFINKVSRGLAFITVCLAPLALGLWRQTGRPARLMALGIIVVHVFTVFTFDGQSNMLAILVGGLAAGLSLLVGRMGTILRLLPIPFMLIVPFILPLDLSNPLLCNRDEASWSSMFHRLHIWNVAADLIIERPVMGHGLEASRLLPEGREPIHLIYCDAAGNPQPSTGTAEAIPMHPHNGIVQLWLELGVVGIGLLVMLFLLIDRAARQQETRAANLAIGPIRRRLVGLSSLGVMYPSLIMGSLSFGLWQGWWLSSLWIAAALVMLGRDSAIDGKPRLSKSTGGETSVHTGNDTSAENPPETWVQKHQRIWARKSALRQYYEQEIFARIITWAKPGESLQVGTGPGFFNGRLNPMVNSDITTEHGADIAADIHNLPFEDGRFANIIGVDVLHHFTAPAQALKECHRTLQNHGRVILVEPWAGAFGKYFYRYLHHEDCTPVPEPWTHAFPPGKTAMDGNAAIPITLFNSPDSPDRLKELGFKMVHKQSFGWAAYILTGGFKEVGLPWSIIQFLIRIESAIIARLLPGLFIRAIVVLEKDS